MACSGLVFFVDLLLFYAGMGGVIWGFRDRFENVGPYCDGGSGDRGRFRGCGSCLRDR